MPTSCASKINNYHLNKLKQKSHKCTHLFLTIVAIINKAQNYEKIRKLTLHLEESHSFVPSESDIKGFYSFKG